jgi:hypothetical protein
MQFYSLKAKVDEQNEPFFAQSENVDGVWKETKTFDTMSGVIVGAKIEEKDMGTHGKKKFFMLFMEDEEGICKVQMSHNQVSYGIINSIASCVDKISKFTMKVYRKKEEKDNKTYWNGRSIVSKEGLKKTEWLVKMDTVPKKIPVMVDNEQLIQDGKPVFSDKKVREFWENIFTNTIIAKVGDGGNKPEPAINTVNNNGADNTNVTAKNGDDLPF